VLLARDPEKISKGKKGKSDVKVPKVFGRKRAAFPGEGGWGVLPKKREERGKDDPNPAGERKILRLGYTA